MQQKGIGRDCQPLIDGRWRCRGSSRDYLPAPHEPSPKETAQGLIIGQAEVVANCGAVKQPEHALELIVIVPPRQTLYRALDSSGEKAGYAVNRGTQQIGDRLPEPMRERKLFSDFDEDDSAKGNESIEHHGAEPLLGKPAGKSVRPRRSISMLFVAGITGELARHLG